MSIGPNAMQNERPLARGSDNNRHVTFAGVAPTTMVKSMVAFVYQMNWTKP